MPQRLTKKEKFKQATTHCPCNTGLVTPRVNPTETFFTDCRHRLEEVLTAHLPAGDESVAAAMRYTLLGGGKRLRPLLVYATGHCLGTEPEKLDLLAAAVEMMHAYSLIHDDLPAMDDSPMRRGKASSHIQYGEGIAILTGDGLQSLAFGLLAYMDLPSAALERILKVFASACGWDGMVRGQMLDMEISGDKADFQQVAEIHRLKTAILIEACVTMAAHACGSEDDSEEFAYLRRASALFGLAFQTEDDLADEIGDTASIGKPIGVDRQANKATMVRVLGVEGSQVRVRQLRQQALAELASFDACAAPLRALIGEP